MKLRPYLERGATTLFAASAAMATVSVLFVTLFVLTVYLPLFFTSVDGNTPPTASQFLFSTDW